MKKLMLIALAVSMSFGAFAQKKVTFLKGDVSIFKGKKSFLMEFDMSNSSIDGMDSEAAYIEYTRGKKKTTADADKFEESFHNDKKNFLSTYQEGLAKKMKKSQLDFNQDNPNSDYRMVINVQHIETGNPMRKSSFTTKLEVYEMGSDKMVAEIYVPKAQGTQLGPMSPTVGMRVQYAMSVSVAIFAKYLKKELK